MFNRTPIVPTPEESPPERVEAKQKISVTESKDLKVGESQLLGHPGPHTFSRCRTWKFHVAGGEGKRMELMSLGIYWLGV